MDEEILDIEGVVLKKLTTHHDERGFFRELIRSTDPFFAEGFGQLSYSKMYPNVIKAWHIHKTQIDWWYVPIGSLKVGLSDRRTNSSSFGKTLTLFLGEDQEPSILKIPAGVAHGCKAIGGIAHFFYVTSHVYDPAEEGRIAYDNADIGYNWIDGVIT